MLVPRAGLQDVFGRGFLLVEQAHAFCKSLCVASWVYPQMLQIQTYMFKRMATPFFQTEDSAKELRSFQVFVSLKLAYTVPVVAVRQLRSILNPADEWPESSTTKLCASACEIPMPTSRSFA